MPRNRDFAYDLNARVASVVSRNPSLTNTGRSHIAAWEERLGGRPLAVADILVAGTTAIHTAAPLGEGGGAVRFFSTVAAAAGYELTTEGESIEALVYGALSHATNVVSQVQASQSTTPGVAATAARDALMTVAPLARNSGGFEAR